MNQGSDSEKRSLNECSYDAIVIGSGMGALTFGALMAKLRKWRVLILERHFKIGGFTHTFSRPGGWTWDVGVHYVGEMGRGMGGRQLFDFITSGRVDWAPLPDVYDVFAYPGFTLKVPKGRANFERALVENFPAEKQAIGEYFRDIKRATKWFGRHIMSMVTPQPVSWIVRTINRMTGQSALQTTQQYLQAHIRDPRLRAVLASQWADYGLPPGRSAFLAHAIIVSHYLEGAWYPAGGAGEIPKAVSAIIQAAGGEVLASHEVTKILLENGKAVGVEVQSKKGKDGTRQEFRAPVVVSDAGAWNTFTRLLPGEAIPFRAELETPSEGLEAVELFLGLKQDPRAMGFQGENYWIFSSFDHDRMCAGREDLLEGRAPMAYLSFPSLKDPRARSHTAEIVAPFSYRSLEPFREQPWRRRGADYESAKSRMTEALLDLVERQHPGFRNLVAYAELATPLSFEYFTGAPSGTIYGYPATPDRFRKPWLAPRTPIRNLYLTGADAAVLGVMGALMGGVATASTLLGSRGFLEIMRAARAR
ncbi:MAG TPA: NAD(P)/FAD-dependent oxidoreductase [Candidatus Nitrosotalea sp.]|nr:NAD(P)/FAD-dependent oxidoreductase [Candidatus Nitrosotalea sp.]